jgi:beta-lactamase regulating signal transducer with metallopeptidase domain
VVDLSTLLGIALKTSLLMIVTGMVSAILAKKSSAYRHFLWTCAQALSLLMPLAILCLPAYEVIPMSWQVWESPASGPSGITRPLQIVFAAVGDEWGGADRLSKAVWPIILIVWCAGALGLLIRDALANVGLAGWVRRARPLGSVRWATSLDHVSNDLGFSRPLRVLESPHVASPCTWGVVQPVLLLPVAGADWSESQRRDALLHELAHIRRFDYLSTLVSRLACALHWYNPLVWFAATQTRNLQELACDDAVLRAGGTPSEYAQFLLHIAEAANGVPGPLRIAMGMARRSPLHGRVVAILDPRKTRLQPDRFTVLVTIVPLSCLMLLLAAAATATAPDARGLDSVERPAPLDPIPAPPPVAPVEAIPPVAPVEATPPVEPVAPLPPVDRARRSNG